MIKAYIDTSVISELRKQGAHQKKKHKLIFDTLKKYSIIGKNCIITEKLFLELIYEGDIRKKVVNAHEAEIAAMQNNLYQSSCSEDDIKNLVDSLEQFFDRELRARLSLQLIQEKTLETLEKHPIVYRFRMFSKKIREYASNIVSNKDRYDQFISNLVSDSVVRYALLGTLKRIDKATFTKILNHLLIKYSTMTKEHLLLYCVACKAKTDTDQKRKDQASLIRIKDDFADMEPQHFVFYGSNINGIHFPITFLTIEPLEKIKNRMKYYLCVGIAGIAKESPRLNTQLLLGRTLVIDFNEPIPTEIDSGVFMKQYITKFPN
jgi:hypothetical protein